MAQICRSNKHQDPKMNPDSAKYCSYCGDLLVGGKNNWLLAVIASGLLIITGVIGYQLFFAYIQDHEADSFIEIEVN